MYRILALFLFALPSGYSPLAAQPYPFDTYEKSTDPLMRFTTYTTAHGLSNDRVNAIIQDHEGFIWVATDDGLNRFDGYGFKAYRNNPDDPHSLSDNKVYCLTVDARGDVWAGTANGLNRLDRATGRFVRFMPSFDDGQLTDGLIRELYTDSKGRTWVFTDAGVLSLFIHDAQQFRSFPTLGRTGSFYTYGVLKEDADGKILIGGNRAAWVFDVENESFYNIISFVGTESIESRALGHLSQLTGHVQSGETDFYFTNDGIRYRAQGDSICHILWRGSSIYGVLNLDSVMWVVGYAEGLRRIDVFNKTVVTHSSSSDNSNSIPSNRGYCIYRDRSGCVWIGTDLGLAMHSPGQTRFKVYKGGFTSNDITALAQAPDGTLWAGTKWKGLNSIDIATDIVTKYTPGKESFLTHQSNLANALHFDRRGNMWIGSWQVEGGFSVRDAQTGKVTNVWEMLQQKYGDRIKGNQAFDWCFSFSEKEDTIYVGNWSGAINAFTYRDGQLRYEKTFSHCFWDSNHSLSTWSAHHRAMLGQWGQIIDPISKEITYRPQTYHEPVAANFERDRQKFFNSHSNSKITYFLAEDFSGKFASSSKMIERKGVLFENGKGGLFKTDKAKGISLHLPAPIGAQEEFTALSFCDVRGRVLCALPGRAFWMDTLKGSFHVLELDGVWRRDAEAEIQAVHCDAQGRVWSFAKGMAICALDNGLPPIVHAIDTVSQIRKVVEGRDGDIFLATDRGILHYQASTRSFQRLGKGNRYGLMSDDIIALDLDSADRLWAGAGDGLHMIDLSTGELRHLRHDPMEPASLRGGAMHGVVWDRKSHIWVSSVDGLSIVNTATLVVERIDLSEVGLMAPPLVLATRFDRQGFLWTGIERKGLDRVNVHTFEVRHYVHLPYDTTSLVGVEVNTIHLDAKGRVWVGTEKALHLYLPELDGFRRYDSRHGLPSDHIMSILEDDDGILWIGTTNGLSRFDPEAGTFFNYHEHDGIMGNTFSLAATKLSDGRLAFGGPKGLMVFNPKDFSGSDFQPPIVLTSFMLNGKEPLHGLRSGDVLELSFGNRNIGFEFAALDYNNPERIGYRYILEGQSEDWTDADHDRRYATYTNLAPGDYAVRIQATNSDGIWNKEEFTLHITILPPWWMTWWAYLSYVLMAILAVFGIVRWNTRRLRQRAEELQEEVNIATVEIRNQKEKVEKQNEAIIASIEYARKLQEAVLPPPKVVKEFFHDSFLLYLPRDIVSGDFYWMESKGDMSYFAVADSTGHGVPGAMLSVIGLNGLNRALNEKNLTQPKDILTSLSETVNRQFEKSDAMVRDGMDICLCSLNTKTNKLTFAGANNPVWIARNGEMIILKGDRRAIGHDDLEREFTQQEIQLEKGDVIYLASDGYQDQLGGENYTKFMTATFRNKLLEISSKPLDEQRLTLISELDAWKGKTPQTDDICVMGIRV